MIDWKEVKKEKPKLKKELFLFGYETCKISLYPNANKIIENVFRTGEWDGKKIVSLQDSHPVWGFPFWQFIPTHWAYAEKPEK